MKALATKQSVLVDEWLGCYRGGWKGVIVDEAFTHPAKVAFNLAKRIYEHAIEEGWIHPDDVVIDPFGGIGGCAFHGLMNGMIVVTNELEEKFVTLSKQNRELWREKFTGLPGFNVDNWIILQGDSRKLGSLISEAGLTVSSPPYTGSALGHDAGCVRLDAIEDVRRQREGMFRRDGYGAASGQLGAMPEGDIRVAVSSPPYNPPMSQDHNGSRNGKRGTTPSETGAFVKYGNSEGQIEGLSMEGFQAAISSPPYESSTHVNNADVMTAGPARWEGGRDSGARVKQDYADYSPQNMGNQTGDTFWSASRTILEQLYSVLSPGSHSIFIVKAFVRDKKIVDFPDQWAQLCEAVGFKLIHDHHAMLTEHSGTQGGFFGDKEHKVKRVSFFRRLHEKKSPETAIEYENVLCFERR